jgi:hypothetical protein
MGRKPEKERADCRREQAVTIRSMSDMEIYHQLGNPLVGFHFADHCWEVGHPKRLQRAERPCNIVYDLMPR